MDDNEEPGFRSIGDLMNAMLSSLSNSGSIPMQPSPTSETTGMPKPPTPRNSIGPLRGATGVDVLKTTRERPPLRSLPDSITEKKSVQHWCALRLKEMEADLGRASAKQVAVMLDALCAVYGTPDAFDAAAPFYVDLLPYPAEILREAVQRHMKTSKWFPKPSELVELCERLMQPYYQALEDARADLEFVNSDQYQTIDEYRKAREILYGPRAPGDYSGNRGSSAVNATLEPLAWRPSSETLETLKTWKTIPFDEPEEETSATAAPEETT